MPVPYLPRKSTYVLCTCRGLCFTSSVTPGFFVSLLAIVPTLRLCSSIAAPSPQMNETSLVTPTARGAGFK